MLTSILTLVLLKLLPQLSQALLKVFHHVASHRVATHSCSFTHSTNLIIHHADLLLQCSELIFNIGHPDLHRLNFSHGSLLVVFDLALCLLLDLAESFHLIVHVPKLLLKAPDLLKQLLIRVFGDEGRLNLENIEDVSLDRSNLLHLFLQLFKQVFELSCLIDVLVPLFDIFFSNHRLLWHHQLLDVDTHHSDVILNRANPVQFTLNCCDATDEIAFNSLNHLLELLNHLRVHARSSSRCSIDRRWLSLKNSQWSASFLKSIELSLETRNALPVGLNKSLSVLMLLAQVLQQVLVVVNLTLCAINHRFNIL